MTLVTWKYKAGKNPVLELYEANTLVLKINCIEGTINVATVETYENDDAGQMIYRFYHDSYPEVEILILHQQRYVSQGIYGMQEEEKDRIVKTTHLILHQEHQGDWNEVTTMLLRKALLLMEK